MKNRFLESNFSLPTGSNRSNQSW